VNEGIITEVNLHGMMKTNFPIKNNKYNKLNKVNVDSNFEMISEDMYNIIINAERECYITTEINEQIYGNSYEMAMVLLLQGYNDISATGVVESYKNGVVKFGKIAGLSSKLKIDKNMLHNEILDHIELSPY